MLLEKHVKQNNNTALDYTVVLDLYLTRTNISTIFDNMSTSNIITDIKIDHTTKQIIITNKEQEKKDDD